jgi:hypothetical protein
MHHSAHEPRPLTGWHTGQRADENSHLTCQVNALDVATHHASAQQEGNGDADVSWREKPMEQGRFAGRPNSGCANQRSVRINTQMD